MKIIDVIKHDDIKIIVIACAGTVKKFTTCQCFHGGLWTPLGATAYYHEITLDLKLIKVGLITNWRIKRLLDKYNKIRSKEVRKSYNQCNRENIEYRLKTFIP